MNTSEGYALNRTKLSLLGIAWLISGAVVLILTFLEFSKRGDAAAFGVAILGVIQLSFLFEPKGTPGRIMISGSGALLFVMGLLLLNMGQITSLFVVRMFISLWVIATLILNAVAIGSLGAQVNRSAAGFVKVAATIGGALAIAVAFALADDFSLGLVIASYFIAIGVAISKLASAA